MAGRREVAEAALQAGNDQRQHLRHCGPVGRMEGREGPLDTVVRDGDDGGKRADGPDTLLCSRPMHQLMDSGSVEAGRIIEDLAWWQLDMVSVLPVIGFASAIADLSARVAHDFLARFADFPLRALLLRQPGDAINLFGIEDGVDPVNEAAVSFILIRTSSFAARLRLPELYARTFLALAYLPAVI